MFRRFALVEYPELRCRLPWHKLVVDNECLLDSFVAEIEHEGNMRKQLKSAMMVMEMFGNGFRLPENKLKLISRSGDTVNLFEIKTTDLRIYFLRDVVGAIVVLGGKKTSQRRDISRFRNLVVEYIKEKNR